MRTLILRHIFLAIIVLVSCNRNNFNVNTKGINVNVEIHRFDMELFGMNTDTLSQAIGFLYNKYTDFFEVFSYHIISIGLPTERAYPAYLRMFLEDNLNRRVYQETQKKFTDLKKEEKILTDAFKRYKFYFEDAEIPEVVAFVSRFNNSCFTVSNFIGIGLDMYLGSSSEYYQKLNIPGYIKSNMNRDKISSDIMYTWALEIFPFQDSINNVISHMIHEGKLMYFVKAMLPDQSDQLIMGYTKDQLKWVKKNEEMMWIYLVENKLLFSDNQMDIRKLTGLAPFTFFFTNQSPGRAGVWIGWQIVREFVRRNPDLSLKEIMEENDYQKILQLSKYSP